MGTETIEIIVDTEPSSVNAVTEALALGDTVMMQQPAQLSDLVYANHVVSNDLGAKSQVANQDAMNRLRQTIVANAVSRVQSPGPSEARAAVAVLTSNALAQEIADLKAAVEAFSSKP